MHFFTLSIVFLATAFIVQAGVRPTALHMDVEFHILPEGVPALAGDFLNLMQALKNITGDFPIHSDVSMGYSGPSNYWKYEGRPVGQSLLEIIDGVVVMSYRDHSEGVIELTTPFFPIADPSKKIWSSVETQFMRTEPQITFFEEGEQVMETELLKVKDALSNRSNWQGLAIHYDTSYRAMGEGSGLSPAFPRAMWVWYNSVEIVQNATSRREFLQFCVEKKVNRLFFETLKIVANDDLLSLFASFLEDASSVGIEVEMLFGDPEWTYQENHHIVYELTRKSMDFIRSIPV